MQNLIVGERYSVKHPDRYWEGDVTYLGYENGFKVGSVNVTKGDAVVQNFFAEMGIASLSGLSDWSWEEINICLENK